MSQNWEKYEQFRRMYTGPFTGRFKPNHPPYDFKVRPMEFTKSTLRTEYKATRIPHTETVQELAEFLNKQCATGEWSLESINYEADIILFYRDTTEPYVYTITSLT